MLTKTEKKIVKKKKTERKTRIFFKKQNMADRMAPKNQILKEICATSLDIIKDGRTTDENENDCRI